MTTILCNNDFIFADKRLNRVWEAVNNTALLPLTKVTNDNHVKIRVNKNNFINYKGQKIEAYAYSGDIVNAINFHNTSLLYSQDISFWYLCTNTLGLTESFCLIYLLTDGSNLVLDVEKGTITTHFQENGLSIIGSGNQYVTPLFKVFYTKFLLDEKDLFIWACYNDPFSSCNYDVFDKKTRTITTVNVTKKDLKNLFKKIGTCFQKFTPVKNSKEQL